MGETTNASPAPPKRSRLPRWAKWLLGCLSVVLLLSCAGVLCTGAGLWWLSQKAEELLARDDVDRVYREALAGGDVESVYVQADPRFQKRYSLDDLRRFAEEHPGVFHRDKASGRLAVSANHDNGTYRMVRVSVKGEPGAVEIVCRLLDGVLVLVGISPGLDGAIPSGVSEALTRAEKSGGSHGGRRHRRHHHLFD